MKFAVSIIFNGKFVTFNTINNKDNLSTNSKNADFDI